MNFILHCYVTILSNIADLFDLNDLGDTHVLVSLQEGIGQNTFP